MNRPAIWLFPLVLIACTEPERVWVESDAAHDVFHDLDASVDTSLDETDTGGSDANASDGGASDVGTGATSLSIASWNIEQFPRHARTVETVAGLIVEYELDLIGIQEITDPEPFEALAAALPEHDMYVSFDSRAFTRVGFLYRRDLIRVGEVERIFTSNRSAFPRSPLVAGLSVLNADGEVVFDFTFAVVHLKAMLDEESRRRRLAAVELLDAWIRDGLADEPDVVVVGDWNDKLTDSPTWNVFEPFLNAPETYRFLTLESELAGAHSYIPFEAMIDHILVTSDALEEYGMGTTEVLPIDEGMPAYEELVSDHRPVVSHFVIR